MMDMTHHQAQEIAHFDRLLALSHDLDELDKEIISRRDRGEYEGSFALQLDRAILMIAKKSLNNINQEERNDITTTLYAPCP